MDLFYTKSAVLSECGTYRYLLRRVWDDRLPPFVSGMLNPSTADHEIDDPTIIRNVRRAQALECGSLIVWNLFAYRSTNPALMKNVHDPVGEDNDRWIAAALHECKERNGIAVVGWGAYGLCRGRDRQIYLQATSLGVSLLCLGTTKDGHPRHPLYVAKSQDLVIWEAST
ncbi:DUF1643 domain-containing protein [Rhizobium leguminosarum]|uniref:DUF1643 domain-containing protein n=1 Tax=Rhizobium leguminosarum TaxID=384 RepID=UPI001621E75F|nr:DUF1643 domain-containing protein [Rhizobium leguminosarum]